MSTTASGVIVAINNKNGELWQQYQAKKAQEKMLFPTEGAKALGVSELELMLASPYSQYIGNNCKGMLKKFESLGRMESIVRNDLAVHEKIGEYENLNLGDKMGLAVNVGGLDLRIFMSRWHHMLAVNDTSNPDKPVYSIQFFDERGNAINKVYLRDITDERLAQWQALIDAEYQAWQQGNLQSNAPNHSHNSQAENQSDSQTLEQITLAEPKPKQPWQFKPLNDADLDTLQTEWEAITDVHQFHFLLERLGIDRASSFRQAPTGMACELKANSVETLLEKVRDQHCPIMIFVGNTGMVQIQTGLVHKLVRMGEWINIMDKAHTDFTLHLKDSELAQLWCVKRPTKDGMVTCIEGFDEFGTTIFSIFGQRLEGETELPVWRSITDEMMLECKQVA